MKNSQVMRVTEEKVREVYLIGLFIYSNLKSEEQETQKHSSNEDGGA